jgi:hypothetical protein
VCTLHDVRRAAIDDAEKRGNFDIDGRRVRR